MQAVDPEQHTPLPMHANYLTTRFRADPRRDAIWRHVTAYLTRYMPRRESVLDVGAGYCSFINAVQAGRRVAVDIHGHLDDYAAPGVETHSRSATALDGLADGTFDVVFASNLLEHLTRADIAAALHEFRRVLKPRGRLILVQPNYRLCAKRYFDDFTHLTPLSDASLTDIVEANGFDVVACEARFLPLSLRSRGANLTWLVPLYLALPFRPLAGQMLVIADATTVQG